MLSLFVFPTPAPPVIPDIFNRESSGLSFSRHPVRTVIPVPILVSRFPWIPVEDGFPLKTCGNDRGEPVGMTWGDSMAGEALFLPLPLRERAGVRGALLPDHCQPNRTETLCAVASLPLSLRRRRRGRMLDSRLSLSPTFVIGELRE